MRSDAPDVVVDTNGAKYALDRQVGHGGQGVVYAVRGRNLAVKLSTARHHAAQQRVRESIARIRRLPLDGLNVARPLRALLEPHVGYVMELMTGMVPLETLAQPPREHVSNFGQWYIDTGSLQRRLRILAKMAALFSALHERGLAYGDASPKNVFISEESSASEVWLIDCDNIVQGVSPRPVYTPGYAAPELFRGHAGADSLTDAWSLATLTFETLCVLHPFDGDLVHDGEPELEEQAFRGELPWVDDSDDRQNAGSRGLPRGMVLTPSVQRLAADCFGASRRDRERRPTAAAWAEKLTQAADQVLVCPACGSGFYVNLTECPWCNEHRPPFALINIYLRDPSLEDDSRTPFRVVCKAPGRPSLVQRAAVQAGRETLLTDRHLRGSQQDTPQVLVRIEEKQLVLRGLDTCAHALEQRRAGKVVPLAGRTERVDLPQGKQAWWLVPLDVRDLHRVASFELHQEGLTP
jgi:DNA-binding helix-hairpin-helix protein with protein kinase domain